MVRRWTAAVIVGCALSLTGTAVAGDTTYDVGGRVSPQTSITTYPDTSVFEEIFGSSSVDSAVDARAVFGLEHDSWRFDADYQLVGVHSDRLEYTRELPEELQGLFPHLPDDSARLFDLTHVITDSGTTAVLQRLDRLAIGHASERVVLKFGRQAISWGNGLIYTVMDIFNPFDPAAVDREYKTGDDMLYGQLLRGNGDDVQGVMVFRRDPESGDVESDQGSLAFKYHHMAATSEYDALLAEHYGDTLLGVGVNCSLGGAVWRGDLAVTFTDDDTVASLVTSLSQSWTWGAKNVSGVAEYFYNGFGQSDGCYSPTCLAANPELLKRVVRGELFTLGQHYIALSAMIEVHPLFLLTPNVFLNVADPSVLLQVVFQNDLRENLLLWSAVNLPVGGDGTEFGGPASGVAGRYLSAGPSASVQLVWYW